MDLIEQAIPLFVPYTDKTATLKNQPLLAGWLEKKGGGMSSMGRKAWQRR